MEQQNKYRVIVSARAADSTHISMGIPAYFIVCLQIRSSRSAFSSRCPQPLRGIGKSR